jgi:hypothetical protein
MFYDLNDNPIASFSGSIDAAAVQIYEMKIDCRANRFLACGPVADLTVQARWYGDVSWIDIESVRIELSPFANTRRRLELRVTASSPSIILRRNIPLRIEP